MKFLYFEKMNKLLFNNFLESNFESWYLSFEILNCCHSNLINKKKKTEMDLCIFL